MSLLTDSLNNGDFYFQNFEDLDDFTQNGIKAVADVEAKDRNYFSEYRYTNSGFVGPGTVDFLNAGVFNEYINRPALDSSISAFDNLLSSVDMGGAFKKSKLIITADKKGIFDFSLASKGLYAVQEYYSEELKQKYPFEFPLELPGIVPPMDVMKNAMDDYWYTSKSGEKFQCKKQDKGTLALDLKLPKAKKEYRSTTKKSYIMFEKKGGKAKMVDLYVGIGALGDVQPSGMLARALPLLLAARYFEQAGIRTRVMATRMYEYGRDYFATTFTIKDYGEDIDFNYLAVNLADTRFFRWNMWKYQKALLKRDFKSSNSGYGSTIYGGLKMLEIANRYKNWYFEEMSKGRKPELRTDRNLMIFGGLPDPPNEYDINSGRRDDLKTTEAIKKEFYRVLDVVDFQFNKPELAAKRVYDRMVVGEGESVYKYKQYVSQTLSEAYSYSKSGQYATEKERQDLLEDEYDLKIEGMNNYLATIQ